MIESKDLKFGVVVSHGFGETDSSINGAWRNTEGKKISENQYSQQVANNLMVWGTAQHAVRKKNGTLGASVALLSNGYNGMIEMHCNAFDRMTSGCEIVVIKGDKISKNYALEMIEHFKKLFPNRKIRRGNGIKEVEYGERGYKNLSEAKAAGMVVAMLTEFFFIDNDSDWIAPSAYATVIKRFIEGLK